MYNSADTKLSSICLSVLNFNFFGHPVIMCPIIDSKPGEDIYWVLFYKFIDSKCGEDIYWCVLSYSRKILH